MLALDLALPGDVKYTDIMNMVMMMAIDVYNIQLVHCVPPIIITVYVLHNSLDFAKVGTV